MDPTTCHLGKAAAISRSTACELERHPDRLADAVQSDEPGPPGSEACKALPAQCSAPTHLATPSLGGPTVFNTAPHVDTAGSATTAPFVLDVAALQQASGGDALCSSSECGDRDEGAMAKPGSAQVSGAVDGEPASELADGGATGNEASSSGTASCEAGHGEVAGGEASSADVENCEAADGGAASGEAAAGGGDEAAQSEDFGGDDAESSESVRALRADAPA